MHPSRWSVDAKFVPTAEMKWKTLKNIEKQLNPELKAFYNI